MKKQNGFTLIEVIVVAGIIAILAGILVPLNFKEIDETRITRAAADIKSISTGILIMKKDTGKWPNLDGGCNPLVTFVYGDGNTPGGIAAKGYVQTTSVFLMMSCQPRQADATAQNGKAPTYPILELTPGGMPMSSTRTLFPPQTLSGSFQPDPMESWIPALRIPWPKMMTPV